MRILLFLIPFALLSVLGPGCSGPPAEGVLPAETGPTPTLLIPLPNWHLCNTDGICEFHGKLGAGLTAAVPADGDYYYTAHENGDVALYDVHGTSRTVLASDLIRPQGMVIADGRLYVSHLNDYCDQLRASTNLLQPDALDRCDLSPDDLLDGVTLQDALSDLSARTSAEVVSWRIDAETRQLSDRKVELDQLPALGARGGPRGMAFAAGRIFLSVGNPGVIGPFEISDLHRPDTAGAVIHFIPGQGEDYAVFADGLGTLHSISPGPQNTLFGAGPGPDGTGAELKAIRQGQSHGRTADGETPARAVPLDGTGATAVHVAGNAVYVAYSTADNDFVLDRFDYRSGRRSRYYQDSPTAVVSIHEQGSKLHIFTRAGAMALLDRKHSGPISAPDGDSNTGE